MFYIFQNKLVACEWKSSINPYLSITDEKFINAKGLSIANNRNESDNILI